MFDADLNDVLSLTDETCYDLWANCALNTSSSSQKQKSLSLQNFLYDGTSAQLFLARIHQLVAIGL